MKKPLISIIMPTYNRKNTLPRAIQSVLSQTYKNWELIIVDDGSIDNTSELIEEYSKKNKKITYIQNTHKKGVSGARNTGIEKAKGEYIAFLDSDDEWFKHHLEESIRALKENNVNACSSLYYFQEKQELINRKAKALQKAIDFCNPVIKKDLIIFNKNLCEFLLLHEVGLFAWASTLVLKKELLEDIMGFNEDLLASEDIDFTYRLYHNLPFCWINNCHAIYHTGGKDNLHSFEDKLDMKKVLFNAKYWIKARKNLKKAILKSDKIKRKKQCLKFINKMIRKKNIQIAIKFLKLRKYKQGFKYYIKAKAYLIPIRDQLGIYGIVLKNIFPNLYLNLRKSKND